MASYESLPSTNSDDSDTSIFLPPVWSQQRSRKSKGWKARSIATISVLFVLLGALVTQFGYWPDVTITVARGPSSCQDPYKRPGFLWRASNRTMARWIPYLDFVGQEDFHESEGRFANDVLPAYALQNAPLSYTTLLQNPNRLQDERLSFLKGKTISVVGCSLDRNAIVGLCHVIQNVTQVKTRVQWGGHDFTSCYVPEFDFQVEVWFHFGIREHVTVEDVPDYAFEDRVSAKYLPAARNTTRNPDLLLFASGTWDQLWLKYKFYIEELRQTTEDAFGKPLVQLLPWQALAFQRRRLTEMVSYLRSHFPATPVMYRPETYFFNNTYNTQVYQIRESAIATMNSLNVPVFPWAEKLVGELDMYDDTHFSESSGADWLYADMIFHYLKTATEGSYC